MIAVCVFVDLRERFGGVRDISVFEWVYVCICVNLRGNRT